MLHYTFMLIAPALNSVKAESALPDAYNISTMYTMQQ